jgi:hypothetical protein
VWSLIILFTLYHSFGPLYLKRGGNAARNLIAAVGGPGGGRQRFSEPPPGGGSGAAPPKLKTDVKLPCKSIVISSQSGPFIRQMI